MPSIVFRGNVVLPGELLPGGVVIVENGRIVAVGPEREVKLPVGAEIIDAPRRLRQSRLCGHSYARWRGQRLHGWHAGSGPHRQSVRGARPGHDDHFSDHHDGDAGPTCRHARRGAGSRPHLEFGRRREDRPAFTGTGRTSPRKRSALIRRVLSEFPIRRNMGPHFKRGIIKSATCAAELPGAVEFCRSAARRGLPGHLRAFQRLLERDGGGL